MPASDHDYQKFPELTNTQLTEMPFDSPHPQITGDFEAKVTKVIDADTVTLLTSFRDFPFPLRLLDVDAQELSEGGEEAAAWLRRRLLGKQVMVLIDGSNRVGKYGRLLGEIISEGMNVVDEMRFRGLVAEFGKKNEQLPDPVDKIFRLNQWFS